MSSSGLGKKDFVITSGVSFLLTGQNPDGGWGYGAQQSSAVEPTAAVLLALRETPSGDQTRRRAMAWLRGAQHRDGGWGLNSDDTESAWQTAWAVLALAKVGEAGNFLNRGTKWLLDVKTLEIGQDIMEASKRISPVDPSLRGWPWLAGEASFIEPTALALLALESTAGVTGAERIREAIQYIQDRRCPGGGWNVGSPIMFNTALPGRAYTTALVLLALAGRARGNIRPEDVRTLRLEMHRGGSPLALAWGLLALRSLGEDDEAAETRLCEKQARSGGWEDNAHKTATSLMALRGASLRA
jgi:hypothetical protein